MTKYQTLKNQLLTKIQTKAYPVGEKFPSQNMLMRSYSVSYATVSRVLRELQAEGVIERIRGKGSFVRRDDVALDEPSASGKFTIKAVVSKDYGTAGSSCLDMYQGLLMRAMALNLKVQNIPFSDDSDVGEISFDRNDFFFLFNTEGYEKKIISELQQRHIPFVCHGAFQHIEHGYNFVAANVRTPTHRITSELIQTGHKRILFIHEDIDLHLAGSACFTPKMHGYRDAMLEAGLAYEFLPIHFYDTKDAATPLDRYIAQHGLPQAVIAATDIMAWSVMDYLKEKQYQIPEDVAVVGYANLPRSSDSDVSLTSIDYPRFEIGKAAVDWMVHLKKFPEIAPACRVIESPIFYRNTFPGDDA